MLGSFLCQAPGAWPNGTRVAKAGTKPGDAHQDGALGRVVGSWGPVDIPPYPDRYAYFVEWDDLPGLPVGIREGRLRRVEDSRA